MPGELRMLADLARDLAVHVVQGDPRSTSVSLAPCYDSRRAEPGGLFVALAGANDDGHRHVADAVDRGAVAVVVERTLPDVPPGVCVVRVADTRLALAHLSARWFAEPGRGLQTIAVTGTNGKTSVCCTVEGILRGLGERAGVIGTAGHRIAGEVIELQTTTPSTPEAPELQLLLRTMADRGARTVAFEASSMALQLKRVEHCFIDVGVFTNLSPEHLDDHGTVAAYKHAKLELFRGRCRHAVLNADDPVSAEASALMPAGAVTTFGLDQGDFQGHDISIDRHGSSFTLRYHSLRLRARVPMPGVFAVRNALAALAVCTRLGYDLAAAVDALSSIPRIPGHFEVVPDPTGRLVVVDFAHTPEALRQLLRTVRQLVGDGRVVVVFGCGGDRDPAKRAPMGHIAASYADVVILTNDNPRSENPDAIIDQIAVGVAAAQRSTGPAPGSEARKQRISQENRLRTERPSPATPTPASERPSPVTPTPGPDCVRLPDRAQAIEHALSLAKPEDAVVIAGRGHEDHQLFADGPVAFNDYEVVHRLLA